MLPGSRYFLPIPMSWSRYYKSFSAAKTLLGWNFSSQIWVYTCGLWVMYIKFEELFQICQIPECFSVFLGWHFVCMYIFYWAKVKVYIVWKVWNAERQNINNTIIVHFIWSHPTPCWC
jgi:hypothetical protein